MSQNRRAQIEVLSGAELERLNQLLLERIDENIDTRGMDEGILDVSELDGFFTAIVSGPVIVEPSQWLPVVWGDFEPEWGDDKEVREYHSTDDSPYERHCEYINGSARRF